MATYTLQACVTASASYEHSHSLSAVFHLHLTKLSLCLQVINDFFTVSNVSHDALCLFAGN
jgi:hypothetical protein